MDDKAEDSTNSDAQLLAAVVGAPVPDAFARLSIDQLRVLAQLVESSISAKLDSLDESIETSVQNLPIMLRGPVRAALKGGKSRERGPA